MIKKQALLVGSFVIGALALVIAAILWLSDTSLFQTQLRAIVYFRGSVSGLYIGAPVTFRGVQVGQVDQIDIQVDHGSLEARIPVRLRIRPDAVTFTRNGEQAVDLPDLVQRGLRARLVAQSFVTGQKSIDLDFVPDALPPQNLTAGPGGAAEIPAVADRFDALFDQLAELPLRETVRDLRMTLDVLRLTLDSTRKTLDVASAEVAETAAEARKTLAVASSSLLQVQGSAQSALASMARLTDTTREAVQAAQPELQRSLDGARQAADQARLAMTRVAELTAPGAPLRSDLDGAVRDLSQAARSLREWAELLEDQPNAVIFGSERR